MHISQTNQYKSFLDSYFYREIQKLSFEDLQKKESDFLVQGIMKEITFRPDLIKSENDVNLTLKVIQVVAKNEHFTREGQEFIQIIKKHHLLFNKTFLSETINPNAAASLLNAINDNEEAYALFLLSSGVPIPKELLGLACTKGLKKLVQVLIDKKADLNHLDDKARTPLHLSIQYKQIDIACLLVKAGANYNLKGKIPPPWYYASKGNHTKLIRLMVQGIPDKPISGKLTPLQIACQKNFIVLAHLLVDSGANIHVTDEKGLTPLHWACKYGYPELAQKLLEKRAKTTIKDQNGYTALDYAYESGEDSSYNLVKLLIDYKATSNDFRPLHFACWEGDLNKVKELISTGKKINAPGAYDITPLHWACRRGHLEVVQYLLEQGADPNLQDEEGATPLHYASQVNLSEMIEILLAHDANPYTRTQLGATFLTYSNEKSEEEELKALKLLLKNPTDVQRIDLDDMPLICWALEDNKTQMIEKLVEQGADLKEAEESLMRKLLGHIWSLKGTSQLKNYSINLEGFFSTFPTSQELISSVKEFFNSSEFLDYVKDHKLDLNVDVLMETLELLMPDQQNAENLLKHYQKGLPILLRTGWEGHATCILIHANKLIKVNRGAAKTTNSIEIYQIPDQNKVDENLIARILQADNKEFFLYTIDQLLNLEHLEGLQHKKQPVENCMWESLKTLFHGLLYVHLNSSQANTAAWSQCLYKMWGLFERERIVRKYLNTSLSYDETLLKRILEKAQNNGMTSVVNSIQAKLLAS